MTFSYVVEKVLAYSADILKTNISYQGHYRMTADILRFYPKHKIFDKIKECKNIVPISYSQPCLQWQQHSCSNTQKKQQHGQQR